MDTSMREDEGQGCHIQVAVRVRPASEEEEKRGLAPVVSVDTEKSQAKIKYGGQGMKNKVEKVFTFDRVFGRFSQQEEVFKTTVSHIVDDVLQGLMATVFMYGPTGTGKTFTMEGDLSDPKLFGVIPRSVSAIFERLEGVDFSVRVSFLEIYNEEIMDLLDPMVPYQNSGGRPQPKKLRLIEDIKKGVQVLGLEEHNASTAPDVMAILKRGIEQRQTAATLCNKNSSRSHSVFTVRIVVKETTAGGEDCIRTGQLNLVDLAGSECVGRSGAKGDRQREAGNINQSLLSLGRVIAALEKGESYVPYRDSKLTRLLQESLGGRAKTTIIATVSPSPSCIEETLSTLDYAFRAKSIKNKPEVNQRTTSRTLLKEYSNEIESLKSMLQAAREKNGVYLPPVEYDRLTSTLASQTDQLKEAEQRISQQDAELEEGRGARVQLQADLDVTEQRLGETEAALAQSREEGERLTGELRSTRVELAATQAVVAEQAQAEERLLSQAHMLAQSLDMARADVAGLVAKIERSVGQLEARSKRAEGLNVEFGEAVADTRGKLRELGAVSDTASTALGQALERVLGEEGEQLEALLRALKDDVGVMAEEGGAAARRVGKEMCARLSKEVLEVLVQESRRQSEALVEQATAFQGAMAESSKDVSVAFEEASSAVHSTLEALTTQARDAAVALQELESTNRRSAEAVVAELEAGVCQLDSGAAAAQTTLQAFLDQHKAQLQSASQAMTEMLQQQMTQMLQDCETMSCDFLATASTMTNSQQALRANLKSGVSSSIKASMAATSAEVAKVQAKVDSSAAAAGAGAALLRDTLQPAHAERVARVELQAGQHAQALREHAQQQDGSMQATLASGVRVTESIEREMGAIGSLLQDKGAAVLSAAEASGQQGKQRHQQAQSSFTSLLSSALTVPSAAALDACTASLGSAAAVTQDYAAKAAVLEPPTQTTPQKRPYPEPEKPFARTRAHEDIMSEARLAAADVVQGEDQSPEAQGSPAKRAKLEPETPAESPMEVVSKPEVEEAAVQEDKAPAKAAPAKGGKGKATTRSRIPRGPSKALGALKANDMNAQG